MNRKTERRTHEVKIMTSTDEFDMLRQLAQAHGLSLAEYLRSCGLARVIKPINLIPAINRTSYANLGGVAGNLQRLYIFASDNKKLPADFSAQLVAALKLLKKELHEVRTQLIGSTS